jgi:hypothetical protein
MPLLQKSERVFYTVVAFYSAFFLISLVEVISINIKFEQRGFKNLRWVNLSIFRSLVYYLTYCCMQLAVCWICEKYNEPLMTRKDVLSGKNISLLMFIRSQYDMRQIFDPDTIRRSTLLSS